MGQRTVQINVQVDGVGKGEAELKGLSSAFAQVDQAGTKAASGGMQNAFNATSLLRSEMTALGSQIPFVGRLFSGATSDLIRYASAGSQVVKQNQAIKSTFSAFQAALSQAFRGKNEDVSLLFQHIGIDVEQAMTKPLPAFKTFL